ncbi:unnamed protein product [Dicrocoelium dendriticum]|nr:unnamed protein product [Dicrocoelium dendriticum]
MCPHKMALNQPSDLSEPKFITVNNAAQQSHQPRGSKRNLLKSETKQRRPYPGHPTTVRKGCGLQDLCEDDRAKLTRLIFELATTQQALSDLQRAQTNNHAVSPYSQNISSTTLRELSPGRTVLCNRNPNNSSESDHKCPSLPSDEGASYRSRLTCLETELQEIRSLLTKQAIDEDNSRPHVGERAPTCISTPNEPVLTHHRKRMIPKGNSETPTCTCGVAHLRDKEAKSVETSDASVSVVAPIKLRDASVSATPPDDQQPREKLLFERDTLRRQQRVLSVVAKQQAHPAGLTDAGYGARWDADQLGSKDVVTVENTG